MEKITRAFWLLTFFLCSSVCQGGATVFNTALFNNHLYLSFKDWAAREAFTMTTRPNRCVTLSNRVGVIDFCLDSRRAEFNGVGIWLSYPILSKKGVLYIPEKDIQTLFNPLIHPKKTAAKNQINLIAISPGHGGKDPGFEIEGHQEKKYTLLLSKTLQAEFAKSGFGSFLIRNGDEFVDRESHSQIANKRKADLFIAIHFNSAPDSSAKGIEVYALTPIGAPPTNGGEPSQRSPGNKNDDNNVQLAYLLQRALTKGGDAQDRGMRRAGFHVLRSIEMPGVLIEGGFMSNRSDAKKIYNPDDRKKLARAIVEGVIAYKRTIER